MFTGRDFHPINKMSHRCTSVHSERIPSARAGTIRVTDVNKSVSIKHGCN